MPEPTAAPAQGDPPDQGNPPVRSGPPPQGGPASGGQPAPGGPQPGGQPHRRFSLQAWGQLCARRPLGLLAVWLVILVGSGLLYPTLEKSLGAPDYTVRHAESARAQQLVAAHFPVLGAEQDVVVFRSTAHQVDAPEYRAAVDRVLAAVRAQPRVTGVVSPYEPAADEQVAADRRVAVAVVGLAGSESVRAETAKDLQRIVADSTRGSPLETYLTGPSPLTNDLSDVELADQERAEMIGIPIALGVLLLCLGGVVAAGLPLLVALASVLGCTGLLVALAGPLHLDRFATVITTVIGIGIGIDYALFIVSRYREELARAAAGRRPTRDDVRVALGRALHTSGRTIVISGAIVIVALSSLVIIDGHIFMEIAVASALVVATCLVTSLTLLPALLSVLGHRINSGALPRRLRPTDVDGGERQGRWSAWARTVLRRPVAFGLPALILLIALAWPVASIKLGIDWGLAALSETPSGKGQQIVSTSFSPGAVGPVQTVVCADSALTDRHLDGVARLTAAAEADGRVDRVTSITGVLDRTAGSHNQATLQAAAGSPAGRPVVASLVDLDRGGRCTYLQTLVNRPVDSPAAIEFVTHLRERLVPDAFRGVDVDVQVGGLTAQYADLAKETTRKLPWVVGIVLALSFGYLLVVFRSLFVPAKAVVLNLLATTAAVGLTVIVFQYGYGEGALGFTSVGNLQAYLPVALFALLFGLSMDYEVFMVSRIQEEWLRSGDNDAAVATALQHTARQITAGAAIMIAVFGALIAADVLELKQFGFGLAVAVLIDATVVRMLLVPAAMKLASGANWWLPGWLGRLLPKWRVE
ncbi:membrane protein [Pilimelia terevasa]|uniref:Membrane protein n=1 Tax=Pilimelia terevasa TaxID=53372 RepID=A0A8J3BPI9_9ACTN|nr:MMPL family transporter [Pilimelia terevasa]GGK33921.1 membrane protein [Pilimelia terevasa]